ncbi:MAG: hypothetical protein M3460_28420 [Actinomycetota bacterium]|nr:hypothetical protein [Actinomycetota bacterium]
MLGVLRLDAAELAAHELLIEPPSATLAEPDPLWTDTESVAETVGTPRRVLHPGCARPGRRTAIAKLNPATRDGGVEVRPLLVPSAE